MSKEIQNASTINSKPGKKTKVRPENKGKVMGYTNGKKNKPLIEKIVTMKKRDENDKKVQKKKVINPDGTILYRDL